MPFTPAFWYEVCHLYRDPDSDAPVRRLTSAAAVSHNIYCEQPYASPDGKRVAIIRSGDFNRDFPWCDLLVADLDSHQIAYARRDVHSQIVNTAWGPHVFYWRREGGFHRLSLDTLDETCVLDRTDLPPVNCGLSISPDEKWLAYGTAIPGDTAARFGVVRVNLDDGSWSFAHESPAMVNPHTQFNPTHGRTLLLQENINPRTRADGKVLHLGDGANLLLVDLHDGATTRLPIGGAHSPPSTGHQCFIPGGDRVLLTVTRRAELDALGGGRGSSNLLIVEPGRDTPVVVNAPDHECFSHVSASRCGRYFVVDSYRGLRDPVRLVIGSLTTGKYRTLLRDCKGTHGPQQWGHAHAYMTADNRHVIFNSDYQGHGQVYAAGVPEGFLESLV